MLYKFKKKEGVNSITEAHLKNLVLNSVQDINNWFKRSIADQYKMKNLPIIVNKIKEYKDKVIFIFGDYDVDGTSAISILIWAMRWAGFKNIRYRIPKRCEGFGLNKVMVDEVNAFVTENNLSVNDVLILTVDNGIAALEPISYAKSFGYTVIVTDHHQPVIENGQTVLPCADYILDAAAIEGSADFDGYCGAGNAYKIARVLLGNDNRIELLKPIAMLATFCDQMVLTEENYVIAYQGLKVLNNNIENALPGLKAMAYEFGISHWTGVTAGFTCGPAINALERMYDGYAKYAVELLTSSDYSECLELMKILKQCNDERKLATANAYENGILPQLKALENTNEIKNPVIVYVPDIKPGIIGILAAKILERYNLPCAVFTNGQDGILKGSFRAPEGYDIKEHLDRCADSFLGHGGHAGAAGASVTKDGFEAMVKNMQQNATPFDPKATDTLEYDVEIKNEDLLAAITENEKFQPLGNGNPDLIFKVTGFQIVQNYGSYKKEIGGGGIKFVSSTSTAVGFGLAYLASSINGPATLTLYGNISNNFFKKNDGTMSVTQQIQFVDFEIENLNQNEFTRKLANMSK